MGTHSFIKEALTHSVVGEEVVEEEEEGEDTHLNSTSTDDSPNLGYLVSLNCFLLPFFFVFLKVHVMHVELLLYQTNLFSATNLNQFSNFS